MAFRAGAMDRRITFQQAAEAADAFGDPVKTWANIATTPEVWAQVLPVQGRELFNAAQVLASFDARFRVRYRTDLSVEYRIVYGGANYDIQSITEIGRGEGLEIVAKKAQT